jgi:hypothetical protein
MAQAAAKERMREKIAASKKNYRTTSDLVQDRKETTDYSCLVFKDCPASESAATTSTSSSSEKASRETK